MRGKKKILKVEELLGEEDCPPSPKMKQPTNKNKRASKVAEANLEEEDLMEKEGLEAKGEGITPFLVSASIVISLNTLQGGACIIKDQPHKVER